MRFALSLYAVLFCCLLLFVEATVAQTPEAPSVTTTWLPDPFPNTPPRARDRNHTVEINTISRTPSVLLGVYDVENDPLSVSSFTQPEHGAVTPGESGVFLYSPERDFLGDDEFTFEISDGRGGLSSGSMQIRIVQPSGNWATTSFNDLTELSTTDGELHLGTRTTVPRAVDWNRDGKTDLLVGALGTVQLFQNIGTATSPRFAAGVTLQAGGEDIQCGTGRVAIAWSDMNRDGKSDLLVVADPDRKMRYFENQSESGETVLAAPILLQTVDGDEFVAEDIRIDIADWNGDGLPDIITGSRSGSVKIAYNRGTPDAPAFNAPTTVVDADGQTVQGSYNLNVRLTDVNQDGLLDFIDTYNWGTIKFRINTDGANEPRLTKTGQFNVTWPDASKADLHGLSDGPIVDFADLNGDGVIDLILGGEVGGKIHIAFGQSGESYLDEIRQMIAAHPEDLGPYLADSANAAAKERMQSLQGALYDYVVGFATPSQKNQIGRGLADLIAEYPIYFRLQEWGNIEQPGISSLAVQMWLTLLMVKYDDPAARSLLCDVAGLTGGYRQLVEDIGLIYADGGQNPRGAEAIYQWVRTIPREVYPGTCITANDWLGGRVFLVRGHMKNTFNGYPSDNGEYGFGRDARDVIGSRGSENWFMTVVCHEACHDLDAYVRGIPDLQYRWGQTLVLAGGPDMCPDPETGWFSRDLTKQHFLEAELWNGEPADWDAAWEAYWETPLGAGWQEYGFMRGNTPWFYGAPQESLATQGNQYWNSTEGRIQVALDRWERGYESNLTEVLFYMDIWSLGYNKIKFSENDNDCNQVISYAKLRRNGQGYIDRIDLSDRYYEFGVDDQGVVTEITHAPAQPVASE